MNRDTPTPYGVGAFLCYDTDMENNGAPKTITPRTKQYRENLGKIGWHVHTPMGYIGYKRVASFEKIVDVMAASGFRLVYIGGNVLDFHN